MSDHLEFEADLYDMDLEYYSSPNDWHRSCESPTGGKSYWNMTFVDQVLKDIPFELALECLSFLTIGEIHELSHIVRLNVSESDRLFQFVCRLATNCKRNWTKTNLKF